MGRPTDARGFQAEVVSEYGSGFSLFSKIEKVALRREELDVVIFWVLKSSA